MHTHKYPVHNSESNNCTLFTEKPFKLSENCGNLLDTVPDHPRSLSSPLHAELSLLPYPHYLQLLNYQARFPCSLLGKESAGNAEDLG